MMENLKKISKVFGISLLFASLSISAQTQNSQELTNALKDLKEMTSQEKNALGSFKIKEPIVFFLEDKKLKYEDVKAILNNKEYKGVPYKNSDGELRAIVFKKKFTEELKNNLPKK
ncbi:hypothetical protein [Chryseobacterium viscerum]|uniref:hypothetical protein n=1 Tax=Chryseobacterium viscerum TaxID=1037377 RepID=UPI0006468FE3|nr:hypothetical protein [Chryseobacterium viscerum]MCW1962164.1 hypothetical protein [Chryseobacterium viscerum]